jgi:hypothetical protein
MRQPYEIVDELSKNELYFAITFNNELLKIGPNQLLGLQHLNKDEWEKDEKLFNAFNAATELRPPQSGL